MQVMIAVLAAIVSAIIAYGAIGSAVIGLLGPVFIPFLVFQKLDFLFWGWLRAFIGFCFYKVLAAAVFSILGHLLSQYYTQLVAFSDPGNMIQSIAVADSSCPGQYLHPVQDSSDDTGALQRPCGRRRWRSGMEQ